MSAKQVTKVFISQPMNGLSDKEIMVVRNAAEQDVLRILENVSGQIEFLDSFFPDDPPTTAAKHGLYYLGKALQLLAEADYAYFCEGWNVARGCAVERHCALAYGIPVLEKNGNVIANGPESVAE